MRTTEFWLGLLAIMQNGLLELKAQAGLGDDWLVWSTAIVAGAMAAGQNLAAQQPEK